MGSLSLFNVREYEYETYSSLTSSQTTSLTSSQTTSLTSSQTTSLTSSQTTSLTSSQTTSKFSSINTSSGNEFDYNNLFYIIPPVIVIVIFISYNIYKRSNRSPIIISDNNDINKFNEVEYDETMGGLYSLPDETHCENNVCVQSIAEYLEPQVTFEKNIRNNGIVNTNYDETGIIDRLYDLSS